MSEINVESVSKRFKNHINIEGNNRLIFSGKFGIGKTYFLNKFFDDRKHEYNKFLISPVNYVVSSNEDIFELIKADIIKDLFLTGKIDINHLPEDNTLQKISNLVEKKPFVIAKFILNTFSKLDPSMAAPKKAIDFIGDIFNRRKAPLGKNPEDKTISEELSDYWFATNEMIGNIYEHNYITKLINTCLQELKNGKEKKNVLIIDDLDRIDPDHIFRILNVLSTHHGQICSENKFSFDHIVIVCDIGNVKKIFEHKYGKDVDFDGYIDKFYSTDIFYFTNKDALKNYVELAFKKDRNEGESNFLVFIFSALIDQGSLNIRKLLKHRFDFAIDKFVLYEQRRIAVRTDYFRAPIYFLGSQDRLYVESDDLLILKFFKLMSIVYGNISAFLDALNEILDEKKQFDYVECKEMILFLALQEHISCKIGDDLFVSKEYDAANNAGHRNVIGLSYPKSNFLRQSLKIYFQWNSGNQYNSDISFFNAARAVETESISYMNNKSGIMIKASDIYKAVQNIANYCSEKGYLQKAGIHFLN